jgi:NTP pyrophosphatase (non-canonical NTP hydrolase)
VESEQEFDRLVRCNAELEEMLAIGSGAWEATAAEHAQLVDEMGRTQSRLTEKEIECTRLLRSMEDLSERLKELGDIAEDRLSYMESRNRDLEETQRDIRRDEVRRLRSEIAQRDSTIGANQGMISDLTEQLDSIRAMSADLGMGNWQVLEQSNRQVWSGRWRLPMPIGIDWMTGQGTVSSEGNRKRMKIERFSQMLLDSSYFPLHVSVRYIYTESEIASSCFWYHDRKLFAIQCLNVRCLQRNPKNPQ